MRTLTTIGTLALLAFVAGCGAMGGGGADVAELPDEPENPWYTVAASPDPEGIELARESGADPNVRGARAGRTPLIQAIWAGSEEAVEAMLEAGADPTIGDSGGETPLQYAARANDGRSRAGIARMLIDAGADVSPEGSRHDPPIVSAALTNDAELIEVLLENGADPKATDRRGRTALQLATTKGRGEAVRVLRRAEMDATPDDDDVEVEVLDADDDLDVEVYDDPE